MLRFRGVWRHSSASPRRVSTSIRQFSDLTKPGHGKTVAVAMSGGIDSAVAALLLQDQGYNCVGVFMKNWDSADECGSATCDISADVIDMRQVCKRLNIPAYEVDFVKEYWNEVFTPFLDAYQTGVETPNPDAFCNRFVKFNHFRKYVTQKLGIDTIATGHYARMVDSSLTGSKNGVVSGSAGSGSAGSGSAGSGDDGSGDDGSGGAGGRGVQMLRGVDPLKDQSYFLALTKGAALRNVLFPIGHLPKAEVKAIASARLPGLNILTKHESMGICFIGKRDMKDFLQDYITLTKGRFIDLDTGRVVGQHANFEYFTIGQKARLPNFNAKYYVVGRKRNVVAREEGGSGVSGANNSSPVPVHAGTDISGNNTTTVSASNVDTISNTATTSNKTETSGDVYVVKDLFHPALFTPYIIQPLRGINWFAGHPPEVLMATLRDEGVVSGSSSGSVTHTNNDGNDSSTISGADNNATNTTHNTNATTTPTNNNTTHTNNTSSKKKLFRCEVKCRYSQLPTGCTMELVLNPELLAFHNHHYNVIHSDLSSDSGGVAGSGTVVSSSNRNNNNNGSMDGGSSTQGVNYNGIDMNNVMIKIVFDVPQRAITPGQILAIYENEVVLGGAVIAVQPLHLADGELLML